MSYDVPHRIGTHEGGGISHRDFHLFLNQPYSFIRSILKPNIVGFAVIASDHPASVPEGSIFRCASRNLWASFRAWAWYSLASNCSTLCGSPPSRIELSVTRALVTIVA